jgi:glycosyltransferase involved in cell wall biosynthesis
MYLSLETNRQHVGHSGQLLPVPPSMQSRPLVIITTRLPPQICGIGTFSWSLDKNWPGDTSQHSFLVMDNSQMSGVVPSDNVVGFDGDWRRLEQALDSAAGADVLLHYAGRGYQRFGCPVGLPAALRKWKTNSPRSRLVVFFHELPASLPVTNRHYWLNLYSRRIAARIAKLADVLVTNSQDHVRALKKMVKAKGIHLLPVSSNIPPADHFRNERARTEFVIFGLPYGRWQTLEIFASQIQAWQQNGLLTKLHIVGVGDSRFDRRSEAVIASLILTGQVVLHGELSAERVSRLLGTVQFALSTADAATWSKSSSLMAFLAHRCAVIAKGARNFEPLKWSVAPEEVGTISSAEIEGRTNAARQWYVSNADWGVLAREIAGLLSDLPRRDL